MNDSEQNMTLEEKCKSLQKKRDYTLNSDGCILVHVDGRAFSKTIKNRFEKPFDDDFIDMMNDTALYLCNKVSGVKLAYVQSDEISLLIKKERPESQVFFNGRLCKMQSIIASLATAKFNQLYAMYSLRKNSYEYLGFDSEYTLYKVSHAIDHIGDMNIVQFDCKAWDVETDNDAIAWFLFRNIDCVKNSKQQAAQTWCSHKELHGKTTDEQVAYLKEKHDVDWNDYDDGKKFGRIIVRQLESCVAVDPDGKEFPYTRNRFVVCNGFDMTNTEERNKFWKENIFNTNE